MSKASKQAFSGDTIIRFEDVSFAFGHNKSILDEVSFTVRRGSKITLMGQNGAGKSTIFGLILGAVGAEGYTGESGQIFINQGVSVATARQVVPRADRELTVRQFFEKSFAEKQYDIDPRIDAVLEVVNLRQTAPTKKEAGAVEFKDRLVKTFSGGQQARLLLASALIQDPDILLLDEPTNNLDRAGIEHLTQFLVDYKKTCLVISHDADFLNSFTHGVLYLDVYTHKVEQYVGTYKDVVEDISRRIEKENMDNARRAKEIQANKDQANVFANKGGQMRLVAKRMREKAEELEEEMVDVRKEDRTIKSFTIPAQNDLVGEVLHISSYSMLSPTKHKPVSVATNISLRKKTHLLVAGPNGVGKSTLLEAIYEAVNGSASVNHIKLTSGGAPADAASLPTEPSLSSLTKGDLAQSRGRDRVLIKPPVLTIAPGLRIGYYRQDFSMMDFNDTVYQSLEKIVRATTGHLVETELRAVAASFLISADAIHTKIGSLSEGQKGLVAFARLVLMKPGLLILDEPTNHINFRHLPVIAKALDAYEGAMILVSHVPEFVAQIRVDEVVEMGR